MAEEQNQVSQHFTACLRANKGSNESWAMSMKLSIERESANLSMSEQQNYLLLFQAIEEEKPGELVKEDSETIEGVAATDLIPGVNMLLPGTVTFPGE